MPGMIARLTGFLFFFIGAGKALGASNHENEGVSEFVMHHVTNGLQWHPWPLPAITLPKFHAGSLDLSLSLHVVMMLLSSIFLIVLFTLLYKKGPGAPSGLTNFLELLVVFVRDEVAVPALGEKDGPRFTPLLCTFFFFILSLNVMGLIPLFVTATSNVNITAALASVTFLFMSGGGLIKHGPVGFIKLFVPPGVPVFLVPLLFPIELMSLFIRPFALTIRLFANMLAGHILIFSILGLIITFGFMGMPALLMALFIYGLETLVAFIQAYIFTLLSATFIGLMLHPSH
jgi:F-type H+-transporting ATPase subunit a